jgi:hypothetical protein
MYINAAGLLREPVATGGNFLKKRSLLSQGADRALATAWRIVRRLFQDAADRYLNPGIRSCRADATGTVRSA